MTEHAQSVPFAATRNNHAITNGASSLAINPATTAGGELDPTTAGCGGPEIAATGSLTLKKGILWSQRKRIFSR